MGFWTAMVIIVLIAAVANVMRAKHGIGTNEAGDDILLTRADGEADRLRSDMKQLKDRIAVLERIVTDGDRNRAIELEREIEALRLTRTEKEARP